MKSLHKNYLILAHNLAKKKFGQTFPNPTVGCLIVNKGKIISKGATGKNGRPHAEEHVIKKAGNKALGSTMYVTLEPCFHNSKNGSCAKQILDAGIKRIYISSIDPNPRTNSRSINFFKKNGIYTNVGINSKVSKKLNRFFFKSIKYKIPYVKVKLATTKDWKITKSNYKSKWISNKRSREYGHFLRSQSQAILTTAKTIIKDNPRLTVRQKNKKINMIPIIILDKNLTIPLDSKIVRSAKSRKVIIFTSKKNTRYNKLLKLGCNIIIQKLDKKNNLNLRSIMKKIYLLNIYDVLVEAGGIFFTNLTKAKLVDELHIFIAPFKVGKKGKPMIDDIKIFKTKFLSVKKMNFDQDIYQLLYYK